ncbi:MAG: GntR family transcriptional regulator [Paracoccaceae bacterium]|nr:GntR family transcriptional regulator [Paracoccaceae bacterium]
MPEQNLPEQIANRLRRDILRGRLQPGSSIKERDTATEMGVSRTPMREAIRILSKEGLVILRPARSPLIANPSFKEVTDWVAVLRALERLSAELACKNATKDDLTEIRAIHATMIDGYDKLDALDLFEVDMSFHLAIARASHNEALAETHAAFLARLWRVRYLSASQQESRDRVLSQHSKIVESLEAGDARLIDMEIRNHLDHLELNIRRRFDALGEKLGLPEAAKNATKGDARAAE